MTKKKYGFIIGLFIATGIYFFRSETIEQVSETSSSTTTLKPSVTPQTTVARAPASIPQLPPNTPSREWQSKLESSIRTQAGPALKEMNIQKVDSFVWNENGIPLHVQSAIVTLKNDKNTETSFRVLVDSETGKILRSWDAPIVDSVNPKDNLRVKLDPVIE